MFGKRYKPGLTEQEKDIIRVSFESFSDEVPDEKDKTGKSYKRVITTESLREAFVAIDASNDINDIQLLIDDIDENGDSQIDEEEWKAIMSKKFLGEEDDSALVHTFSCLDDNKDGYIPLVELRSILMREGQAPLSEQEVDELLMFADLDSDGLINYRSFLRWLSNPKGSKFGFTVDDRVMYAGLRATQTAPGEIGQVVDFTDDKLKIKFENGTFTFFPNEVKKADYGGAYEQSMQDYKQRPSALGGGGPARDTGAGVGGLDDPQAGPKAPDAPLPKAKAAPAPKAAPRPSGGGPQMPDPRNPSAQVELKAFGDHNGQACDNLCKVPKLSNWFQDEITVHAMGSQSSFKNVATAFEGLKIWANGFHDILLDAHDAGELKGIVDSFKDDTGNVTAECNDLTMAGYGGGNATNGHWKAMRKLIEEKFQPEQKENGSCTQQLLSTDDAYLLAHGDPFLDEKVWYDGLDGSGKNKLGMILMLRRDELKRTNQWTKWIKGLIDTESGEAHGKDPNKEREWQASVRAAASAIGR